MAGNTIGAGLAGARAGVQVSRRARSRTLRGGAVLGAVAFGLLLAGCADNVAPSEATVERDAAHEQDVHAAHTPTGGNLMIRVFDDCDPSDPGWDATGGCVQAGGQVNEAEFFAALPQGHPAWQNVPAYLRTRDRQVRVVAVNRGGRAHTFTKVAQFGGGVVPPLNAPGQGPTPECADPATFGSTLMPPGATLRVGSLQPGTHRYMCCIHPWMRTELRLN